MMRQFSGAISDHVVVMKLALSTFKSAPTSKPPAPTMMKIALRPSANVAGCSLRHFVRVRIIAAAQRIAATMGKIAAH